MELIDTSRPEIAKAIELARNLVDHCNKHNFDATTEVFGVAINALCLKDMAYCAGKEDEKDRMSTLLGLSR